MSWKDSYNARISFDENYWEKRGLDEFEEYLNNSPNKESIMVNDVNYIVTIQDSTETDKKDGEKILLSRFSEVINVGDVIVWDNQNWLVTWKDKKTIKYCNKIKILPCNNTLKFYDKNGIWYQIPCVFSDGSIDMQEGKFISLPSGHYLVTILNGTLIKKFFGDEPFQINIECKENGDVIENPTVTYQSQNPLVCTVSSTGLVTLIGTGITNVVVAFGNATDSVTIQSEIVSQDNYNIVLTPSDTTVKANRSLILNAMVTNNGIDDPIKQVGFEVTNVDGSTNIYETHVVNGNSITITAGSTYNKFINIKVYMLAYPNVFINRQIKIISLI